MMGNALEKRPNRQPDQNRGGDYPITSMNVPHAVTMFDPALCADGFTISATCAGETARVVGRASQASSKAGMTFPQRSIRVK